MGFIVGLIKRLLKIFIYFLIFASFIALLPNLPPYTSFSKIELEPLLPREGKLAPNNHLDNIEQLYKGKLLGPEQFQLYKGEVYTSLATGEIVKLSPGGHVTFVTQIGKPCAGLKEEHICGRPLGFVIDDKKNLMYVADAYYGIWSVDLKTDKKTLLVSPNVEIKGQKPKLFNAVNLDSKGNLYYTDSSADFHLYDGVFAMFTDPNGRLLQYNAAKNESTVLMDKLWLANGLVVSPNDDFIVMAETSATRLIKYYLSGPKKGKREVFIAGLPGYPDNLRALPDGSGLQAALYSVYSDDEPNLTRSMAGTPLVRKFLVRLQVLVQRALQALNQYYPHAFFQETAHSIGHIKSLKNLMPSSTGILHIDWNGNVMHSYFHTQGKTYISDGLLFNDKVYIGQPHGQDFVGAVPAPPEFKKAYTPKHQEKPQVRKEAPPPTTTTPKPTTTTPKPTTTTPKPTTTTPKPTTTTPKPTQAPKAETVKPTPAPAPKTEAPRTTTPPPKTTTPPPKEAPKTTTPPPKPKQPTKPAQQAAKQTPPKATPPPPPVQTTTAKPVEKTPPPPPPAKPQETKPKEQKPQVKAESTTAKPAEQKKQAKPEAKAPEPTPIREEIPVDTVKPSKETLKVIKKGGPAEIPNPEL